MEILAWAFFGGIVGSVLMDVTETYTAKVGITSGVTIALVGRWFLSLLCGQFAHTNILDSKPFIREVEAGWTFHFLVGGGGGALMYPLYFQIAGLPFPNNHLIGGLLFGLASRKRIHSTDARLMAQPAAMNRVLASSQCMLGNKYQGKWDRTCVPAPRPSA